MKAKVLLLISNVILVLVVGLLVGLFIDLSNEVIVFNYVWLLITLIIPSIYLLLSTRKKLDASINEVLIPSLCVTSVYFILSLIATGLLLGLNKSNLMLSIIIEIVLLSIYLIVLLVVLSCTSYIRKINNKGDKEL